MDRLLADRLLAESLLDDVDIDDVEDVDGEIEDDAVYDTVLSVHTSTYFAKGFIARCVGAVTDRFRAHKENDNHVVAVELDKDRITAQSFCEIIASAFAMAHHNKTRFDINSMDTRGDFRYCVDRPDHGSVAVICKNSLSDIFRLFGDCPKTEREMFEMLARAVDRKLRNTGDLISDPLVVRWHQNKKKLSFLMKHDGTMDKIDSYEYMWGFKDGLSLVKNNKGKYNFIDTECKAISKTWWSSCSEQFGEYGLCAVRNDKGQWNYMDTSGKIRFKKWIDAGVAYNFNNGYAKIGETYNYYSRCKFIDKSGKYVVDKFDNYCGNISDGLVPVCRDVFGGKNEYNYLRVPECTYLFRNWTPYRLGEFVDGYAVIRGDNSEYNIMRKDGTLVLTEWLHHISNPVFGMFVVAKKRISDGECMWSVIDVYRNNLLGDWFHNVRIINKNLVEIQTKRNRSANSMFVVNISTGKRIDGECAKSYDEPGLFCVERNDGSWNVMDGYGNMVLDNDIGNGFMNPGFAEGTFSAFNGSAFLRFDTNGKPVGLI